jgi:hypothetical protein
MSAASLDVAVPDRRAEGPSELLLGPQRRQLGGRWGYVSRRCVRNNVTLTVLFHLPGAFSGQVESGFRFRKRDHAKAPERFLSPFGVKPLQGKRCVPVQRGARMHLLA